MAKSDIPKNAIEKPYVALFELQRLVSDLSAIKRNHYQLNTDAREDDIEHSFTVAMQCWFIVSSYDLPLDIGLVLKYALAHDFVERYAGDTNTFATSTDRKMKVQRERAALEKLSRVFSEFPDLVDCMRGYETKSDPEALFVWTVDKIQALVLGDLDSWRPYQELAIDYESFRQKYVELLGGASPHAREIFESIIKYCQSTYYDRPGTSQQR